MFSNSRTKPMEVLLVEDGLLDARVTILALRRSGIHHRLTLVRRVDEAIQFLSKEGVFARAPRPDLILLDMTLPDGSGLDVLEAVNDLTDRITTVFLSASEDEEVLSRCTQLHINDFVNKPVNEEKFMRIVREHKKLMLYSTPMLTA